VNTLSPRFAQFCCRTLLGLTCLVVVGGVPSFARAASNHSRPARETLHVVALFRTVTGGRTTSCPSRMLSRYIHVSGCQKVIITTEPGSKVLLTLRYSTNKHYVLHKTGYADARGMYQWVFAVNHNPSTHEQRKSMGIVEVTVALGHTAKGGYTLFRVLPM